MVDGPISCKLFLTGDGGHPRQVVTGFYELAHTRRIRLRVRADEWSGARYRHCVRAVINGRRVIDDLSDDGSVPGQLQPELESVHHYIKRSYELAAREALPETVKMWPLGLFYRVTSRHNAWHRGTKPFNVGRPAESMARRAAPITRLMGIRENLHIGDFESPPAVTEQPSIPCMTRAWDPGELPSAQANGREDRRQINDLRASSICAGRREFGERFYGGFTIDDFAGREYGDCLLDSPRASDRRACLARVKSADICIATTGVHRSIGGRMSEYVAASKAIVSEPLFYTVPEDFAAGNNYLEFRSIEEFVAAIKRLLADTGTRKHMMYTNRAYYHAYVRPDAMVVTSLLKVLEDERED